MEMFFQLWLEVMLPLFFYVFIGYSFNRLFTFDLKTLTNLLVYLFLPVTVFMKMLNSPLSGQVAGGVLFFLVIQFGMMTLISYLAAKWRKLPKTMYGTFSNSVALNNSGNLGLPVHALVFKNDPFAISIGVFIVLFQNIMTFTVGVYNAEATVKMKEAVLKIVKLPIIYSIILGLFLQLNHVTLPHMADIMLQPIAEAFAPFALITLGAQLSATGTKINWKDIGISNILRLVGGPLSAYIIIQLIGIDGLVAQVLFIGSAFPSSRNSALLSFQGPHASFAAQTVLSSTILSAITLPITIQLAMILF
ncbi:MAG: AEC family transporter [Bacillaceae bacterium]